MTWRHHLKARSHKQETTDGICFFWDWINFFLKWLSSVVSMVLQTAWLHSAVGEYNSMHLYLPRFPCPSLCFGMSRWAPWFSSGDSVLEQVLICKPFCDMLIWSSLWLSFWCQFSWGASVLTSMMSGWIRAHTHFFSVHTFASICYFILLNRKNHVILLTC